MNERTSARRMLSITKTHIHERRALTSLSALFMRVPFGSMADLAAGEIDLPSDAVDWKDAMRRRAASAREVFSRHPWASSLMDSREHDGPAQLSYADRVLGTLLGAGFPPREAANAFLVLDAYVYGFQRQQSSLSLPEGVDTFDVAEEILTTIPSEAYPSLMRIARDFAANPHDDSSLRLRSGSHP